MLAIGTLASSGCLTDYCFVHQRYPVVEKPARPQLAAISGDDMQKLPEPARNAVVGNHDALMRYCRQLEVSIDRYNVYAVEENRKSGMYGSFEDKKDK